MRLPDRMDNYHVPGVSVTVIDGGVPVWTCVAGVKRAGAADPITRETLFHVKSVSKSVSAVAGLKLVEAGLLQLDAPLARGLRTYEIPDNQYTRDVPPTLRQLLSHSAGFTRSGVDSYEPSEPLPTLRQSLRGQPPAHVDPLDVDFTPGTRTRYSGGGYGVLQVLLEDVSGRPFADLVDSLVFRPLGMRHSTFPQPLPAGLEPFSADGHDGDGEPIPGGYETLPIMAAGGLWSTAPDLARFVLALEAAWKGGDGLIEPSTAHAMLTPQSDDWGLGLEVHGASDSLWFRHGGSGDGFKALIVGLPTRGAGAVILANADGAGPLRYEILRAIAREYDWPIYRETTSYALATDVGPATLEDLTGAYVWASGIRSDVALRDGALYARFNAGAWRRLFPLSSTEFVTLENMRYRFSPGEGRGVLEVTDSSGTYRAERE
jgi:CubicO group peptidase (beta-lactamase class C family)